MTYSESIVRDVLTAARIPDAAARRDVAEELKTHLEDLLVLARERGYSDQRAETFVRDNFGLPAVVGQEFARLYRFDRLRLYAVVCLTVGITLTGLATSAVYAAQCWLAMRLGLESTLSARHFSREAILIAAAVGAYTAMVAMTRWVPRLKWSRTMCAAGTLALLGFTAWFFPDASRAISLGLIFALLMVGAESFFRAWALRLSANWIVASSAGVLLALFMMADNPRPLFFLVPMWLVIALAVSTAASAGNAWGMRILARRFAE